MKKIVTAHYCAPALRRVAVAIEAGFETSISGTTGNENYGYADEKWDE